MRRTKKAMLEDVREYVELETEERVVSVVLKEEIRFREEACPIFLVRTKANEWYVVCEGIMNLYEASGFSCATYAFIFHLGFLVFYEDVKNRPQ